jgi:hypothetical protein
MKLVIESLTVEDNGIVGGREMWIIILGRGINHLGLTLCIMDLWIGGNLNVRDIVYYVTLGGYCYTQVNYVVIKVSRD